MWLVSVIAVYWNELTHKYPTHFVLGVNRRCIYLFGVLISPTTKTINLKCILIKPRCRFDFKFVLIHKPYWLHTKTIKKLSILIKINLSTIAYLSRHRYVFCNVPALERVGWTFALLVLTNVILCHLKHCQGNMTGVFYD